MSAQTENAAQGHVVKNDAYRANRIRGALAELKAAVKDAELDGLTVDFNPDIGFAMVTITRRL